MQKGKQPRHADLFKKSENWVSN